MITSHLRNNSVTISYRASDGFCSKASYTSKRSGSPEDCWVAAADELARLSELFGFGDQVSAAVEDARERVRQWKAFTTQPAPAPNASEE